MLQTQTAREEVFRMAKVFYQGEEFPLPDGVTAEEAQVSLSTLYPEIDNATYEINGDTGDITFTVAAGTKG